MNSTNSLPAVSKRSSAFRRGGGRILHVLLILSLTLTSLTSLAGVVQTAEAETRTVMSKVARGTNTALSFLGLEGWETANDWYRALPKNHMAGILDVIQQTDCAPSGDLVVQSGEICVLVAGTYTYNSVLVQDGGEIVVEGDVITGGVTLIADTVTIASGGKITADGQGYGPGEGLGAGSDGNGGGYGGWGYPGDVEAKGGQPYGDVYPPVLLGSGGANGGAGGGAIHLIVTDTLMVSGTLSADGAPGLNSSAGGGSGGSLWVEVGVLAGNGTLSANGGDGVVSNSSGGGGGGRIALDFTSSTFEGDVQAWGGNTKWYGDRYGGPGTVYWTPDDRLVVSNDEAVDADDKCQAAGLVAGEYQFATIELTSTGHLHVMDITSILTLTADTLAGDGSATLIVSGTVIVPPSYTLEKVTLDVQGGYVGMHDLALANGGGLVLRAETPLHTDSYTYTFGTLSIEDGGRLTAVPYDSPAPNYAGDAPLGLIADSLTIAAGGTLDSDGQGYGPGEGQGGGSDTGGGGYGGWGSDGSNAGGGGKPYGDVYRPVALGSGGTKSGGGAIHLVVTGTLAVSGTLSANGNHSTSKSGGSGGSIWIEAETLKGNGDIEANGGNGKVHGGGGGGGRIAIDAVSSFYDGNILAQGGFTYDYYERYYGGPGTVYWHADDRLVVANPVVDSDKDGPAAGLVVGEYQFATIELTSTGHLHVMDITSILTLTADTLAGDGSATLIVSGTVIVPPSYTLEDFTLDVQGRYEGMHDLTLGDNGGLVLRAETPLHADSYTYTFGTLSIEDGGRLTAVPYDSPAPNYAGDAPLGLIADSLTIAAGGTLDSDGQGYGPGAGPGAGSENGGAGYGGQGGDGSDGGGGDTYGPFYPPALLGSGGSGGAGGGAIHLVVAGTLTINGTDTLTGTISANGSLGVNPSTGGGSGGSLWIKAGLLAGNGMICANGGNGTFHGGGGGGGRIALEHMSSTFTGDIQVEGGQHGASGGANGERGTIYPHDVDPDLSTLTIAPYQVLADGSSFATLTVTVVNTDNEALASVPVMVTLESGEDVYINDLSVEVYQYVGIGDTDADGVVTATIRATIPGLREVKARVSQVEISGTAEVLFVVGEVHPGQSSVELSASQAPADGLTPVTVTVTTRDASGNIVSGAPITLEVSGSAALTPTLGATDELGQFTAAITDSVFETVLITATAAGIELDNHPSIAFRLADLAVSQTALAYSNHGGWSGSYALRGEPITYTIVLRNLGLIAASQVSLVDNLPDGLTFDSQSSSYGYVRAGNTITWDIGSLPAGEVAEIVLVAQIGDITGQVTNTVSATTTSDEESLANNSAALNTEVEIAVPVLDLEPDVLSFGVLSGQIKAQSVMIQNTGGALLSGLEIELPANLPEWIYLGTPSPLPDIPRGESQDFTLFASPTLSQPVIYQGYITVTADSQQLGIVGLNVEVASVNARDVRIEAFGLGYSLPVTSTGSVLLISQELVTVTLPGGGEVTYQQHFNQPLDGNGTAEFSGLEPGDYNYLVRANGYVPDSGSFTVQPGGGEQSQAVFLETDHFNYWWEITPITVTHEYEIILHFTYEYSSSIIIYPDWCEYYTCTWGSGGGIYTYTGHLPPLVPPPIIVTQTHTAQLELSQDVLLDGEAFSARLKLENTSASTLNVSVGMHILDDQFIDSTDKFAFIPFIPTGLDPIESGSTGYADWIIIPAGVNVTNPEGEHFLVSAVMTYTLGQDQYVLHLAPQWITVHPAPHLAIHYEIPSPKYYCTEFDLRATIENTGAGVARNLRFNTTGLQVTSYTGPPVSFEIVNVTVGGQSVGKTLNLSLGDIPPGAELEILWRLRASRPGRFIAFSAEYRQTNFQELNLPPLIHVTPALIDTYCLLTPVPSDWPWCVGKDRCVSGGLPGTQMDEGEPINTRTGAYDYSVTDLSIPTAAGPLALQRWYGSQATKAYTDTLGYGWTHSLDTRLIFPDDPGGKQDVVLFKAHSANRYEFSINQNDTYTPYPGMCGALTRNDGPPVTYTFEDNAQWTYTFDAQGRLTQLSDPQGNALYYEYDPTTGLLVKVRDDAQEPRYIEIDYDGQGRIETVSDHTGRQVSYTYTGGDLSAVTDVLTQTWSYHYGDPAHPHYLTEVRDPRGVTVERTEFDEQGRAVRQFDGAGELVVEIVYHPDGSTVISDTLGYTHTHTYDARGTIVDAADALGNSQTKAYDRSFRPTAISDPLGNTTQMTWSGNGANLLQAVGASGFTTTMSYDGLNNLVAITDTLGNLTTYTYSDTLLTSSRDALGNITYYTYTTAADWPQPPGLLEEVRDPLGNHTYYAYDEHGQRISTTDAAGRTTTYAYDDLGRVITTTNPQGQTNWTCYDAAGRVVRTVANAHGQGDPCDAGSYVPDPDYDRIHETVYDEVGNAIASIDSRGRVTRTYYDDANRPVYVVHHLITATHPITEPDPPLDDIGLDYNLTSQTIYDAAGQAIASVKYALVGSQVITRATRTYYNAVGRSYLSIQNWVGQSINDPDEQPAYDPTYPDRNVRNETVYDAAGNVVQSIDNAGRVTHYCYDELGRAVKTVQNPSVPDPCEEYVPSANPDQDIINRTVYDANGNAIATIDPLGVVTRSYYDELNRAYCVVRNLVNWEIENPQPPPYDPDYPDQNVRSETAYDAVGNAIASIEWRVVDGEVVSHTTRSYYDELNRSYLVIRNLANWEIGNEQPPPESAFGNDENVASGSLYDEYGRTIASVEWLVVGGELVSHTTRTYYDVLDRPYLVVRNLNPGHDVFDPTPPTCNRDATGEAEPYDVCSETIYDADGKAIASIDPLGRVTRTYYDALDRSYAIVRNLVGWKIGDEEPPVPDPAHLDQNVRSDTVYDGWGQSVARIEWLVLDGEVLTRTARTYSDELGRPITVVQNLDPSHPILDPAPPACNRDQTGTVEPYDVCNETIYGGSGSAIASINPLGVVTRSYYDGLGRVEAVVRNFVSKDLGDPAPPYDLAFPDQNVRIEQTYDRGGNMIATTDVLSETHAITTCFEYDRLGRLAAVVENCVDGQPGGDPDEDVRTEYAYDALGNRIAITDALTHTTSFAYDALGRLASESDAMGHAWSYQYDALAKRIATTDANGDTTYFAYDGLGRLIQANYPGDEIDATHAYNVLGWQTWLDDGVGETTWEYDGLGRPITITDPFSGTVGYAYDTAGNRTGLTYPDGTALTYTYDRLGRLTEASGGPSDLNGVVEYAYDVAGRLLSETRPNEVVSSYAYDALGRQVELVHAAGRQVLSSFKYTYDAVGNRTGVTELVQEPLADADLIFADGFESGDFTAWSSYTPDERLSVTSQAALVGAYGMQAALEKLEPSQGLYVTDDTPQAESRYRARFYFDPNSVVMQSEPLTTPVIFAGYEDYSVASQVFRVEFLYNPFIEPYYYLRAALRCDDGSWAYTAWVSITDALHTIEIDWRRADELPGGLTLWVDDQERADLTGIDNDAQWIDSVQLGALSGFADAQGVFYFDAFESYRQSPPPDPDLIFADGFESGDFSAWSYHTDDSDLSVTEAAALVEQYGMSAYVDDSQYLRVQDDSPEAEASYRARFYFDASNANMASGYVTQIFQGRSSGTTVFKLHYRRSGSYYYVQPYVRRGDESWLGGNMYVVDKNAVHAIEIQWQAATAPGANDGLFKLWIDGTLKYTNSNVDNDTHRIDQVYLWVKGQDGYQSTYCFDAFESRRENYIGLVGGAHGCGEKELQEESVRDNTIISAQTTQAVTTTVAITYTYDLLSRLTGVEYSDGASFAYQYDAVGNRTQKSHCPPFGPCQATSYTYDDANRLEMVNDGSGLVTYTWDYNGNLLDDGDNAYAYDYANRLTTVKGSSNASFTYNGRGDRLSQTVDGDAAQYTLDLAAGLTQVLADGEHTYLYGRGRIAQAGAGGTEYFLADALGSVRQLAGDDGAVLLARSYRPYGEVLSAAGDGTTSYGFTGEWADATGLVYLRARYYAPGVGRFISRDTWGGNSQQPMSYNRWLYAYANPANLADPNGQCPVGGGKCDPCWQCDMLTDPTIREECRLLYCCDPYPLCNVLTDPVILTEKGKKVCNLYKEYWKTPGWWNNQTPHVYKPEEFLTLMLAYEFSPYKTGNLQPGTCRKGSNITFEEDLRHGTTHWFYSQCALYSPNYICSSITPNAIYDFLGQSTQSVMGKYKGVFTEGKSLLDVTKKAETFMELAILVVNAIFNPPDDEWKQSGLGLLPNLGDQMDGDHPIWSGNECMFCKRPSPDDYLWMLPGEEGKAAYLVSANQGNRLGLCPEDCNY